jgi:hypothetical protein
VDGRKRIKSTLTHSVHVVSTETPIAPLSGQRNKPANHSKAEMFASKLAASRVRDLAEVEEIREATESAGAQTHKS